MDYVALKNEIDNDPSGQGYAAFIPNAPGHVLNKLNDRNTTMVRSRMVTARAIIAENGMAGAVILDKLEAAGAGNPAVKWAVKFLQQDAGVDVGHPTTQGMIDQLVAGSVLTNEEGQALKNMALQPASRAEVLGFGYVQHSDLQEAGVI